MNGILYVAKSVNGEQLAAAENDFDLMVIMRNKYPWVAYFTKEISLYGSKPAPVDHVRK